MPNDEYKQSQGGQLDARPAANSLYEASLFRGSIS